MMQQGRGGMGMRKHGRSGFAGKSPRFKHAMKREAEASEVKKKKPQLKFSSLREAFGGK